MKKRIFAIMLLLVFAIQMMFVSGITSFADGDDGEGIDTPIIIGDPEVEIEGMNLVLNGEIALVYHLYVPTKFASGYTVIDFMDENPVRTDIASCTKVSRNRYIVTKHLTAIELSEPVTLYVYDKDGKLLNYVSKSAEDYAKILLEASNATDKEKNIAKTLINYGHYAQISCARTNGWVIGEDYARTNEFSAPTVGVNAFDDFEIEWQTRSETFRQLSMSLKLDYSTSIMLYVPTAEKPTVTVNGENTEVTASERLGGCYKFEIKGISALSLADEYKITVNDAVFTLSALCYCKLAVCGASYDTVNAVKALYEFYQATVDYYTPEEAT